MLKRVYMPRNRELSAAGDQSAADFRGAYGYGRSAHQQDPDAQYGFEPEPNRALTPVEHYQAPGRPNGEPPKPD